jgi:hypothetical protein
MYYTTYIHPRFGEQETDRPTLQSILQFLSYMVFAYDIKEVKLFDENRKEITKFTIPKW